jgi:hypothetical protein
MRLSRNTRALVLLGLLILILIVVIPLIAFLVLAEQKEHLPGRLTPTPRVSHTPRGALSWPVISRNVPVFASSTNYPASNANSGNYNTWWRSKGAPAWLAYELSGVPVVERSKVLLVWYNETYNYNHTLIGDYAYNLPQDYTIDVNPAAGGKLPGTGWVTLITVKGNHYHSRQHLIDMTGNDWIRITVNAVDGSPENYDASIKMDIYDANYGTSDNWIFFGDSITAGAMGHLIIGGVKSFAWLINARAPKNFPVQEVGGVGFLTSADGAKYMSIWLQMFPGKYVGLSYGTDDALACTNPASFYANYFTMVQIVLTMGKIPIVPHIPWGRSASIQQCAPALNSKIDDLYRAFPQLIKGPDFWTFFQKHQDLISDDDIHPTQMGFGAYRQQWANVMLKVVYGIPNNIPSFSQVQSSISQTSAL